MAESEQRRKIRELLEAGLTVRQIARLLDISTQAIYVHKRAIEGRPTPADLAKHKRREPAVPA